MPADFRSLLTRTLPLAFASVFLGAMAVGQSGDAVFPGPKPADIPADWKPWIGEYQSRLHPAVYVLSEKDGRIWISQRADDSRDATYLILEQFSLHSRPPTDPELGGRLHLDGNGQRVLVMEEVANAQRTPDADASASARIKPVRPIDELRGEALAARPPQENGKFRNPDLVELARLDDRIHLDIRYATANDFLGVPVYSQARAFLQRPAAEALLRVQQTLGPLGYGLLIHDAYRPWYVTKIFWEATPPEGKIFVADPAQGSRHNRGCAVDLTLYDLRSGKPIEMPGTYDEMSPRSFPDYPGGTSLARWHRDLLRRAMESAGFTVYEAEWWHFDYHDWKEYGIQNVPFEKLNLDSLAAPVP